MTKTPTRLGPPGAPPLQMTLPARRRGKGVAEVDPGPAVVKVILPNEATAKALPMERSINEGVQEPTNIEVDRLRSNLPAVLVHIGSQLQCQSCRANLKAPRAEANLPEEPP